MMIDEQQYQIIRSSPAIAKQTTKILSYSNEQIVKWAFVCGRSLLHDDLRFSHTGGYGFVGQYFGTIQEQFIFNSYILTCFV